MARPAPRARALCGLFLGVATAAPLAASESPPPALRSLELELQLAREDDFYLVLEPARLRLRLMSRGVRLREFPLSDVRVGTRRVLFVTTAPKLERPRVFEAGRLAPERAGENAEVLAPEPGTTPPPPPVPPSPEEAVTAPGRFALEYADLRLEFAESASRGLMERLGEAIDAIASVAAPLRPRLRAAMTRADLEALYRSLPPGTRLLLAAP